MSGYPRVIPNPSTEANWLNGPFWPQATLQYEGRQRLLHP